LYAVEDISVEKLSDSIQSNIVVGASAQVATVYPVEVFVNHRDCHMVQLLIPTDQNAVTFHS